MDDEYYEQSREELEAQYGADSAISAAYAWLETVAAADFDRSWAVVDPNLRLGLTRAWVAANGRHPEVASYDRDELADALVDGPSSHPLWLGFAATTQREFSQLGYDPETWGAASRPRPVPPDMELVLFLDGVTEAVQFEHATLVEPCLRLLMRRVDDGWLVAAFTEEPREPTWPD